MSIKVRSVLVIVIGTVLGLTVSVGSALMSGMGVGGPKSAADQELDASVRLVAEVMRRIRREYVERIDEQTLAESAIRGMLEELDSHSRFLDSTQYEDIRISTTGNYSGVGLDVSLRDGRVTVVSPLDDSPAAKAGIRAGDVVVSVDDIPVDAENVEDSVNRMRGQPGTEVRLGVTRGAVDEPMSFSLLREEINVQTVRSEYLGNGVGYIRLTGFADKTPDELDRAARELSQSAGGELGGLVLDLRNNPGGVLNAAVGVADRFIEDGLIVRGRGRVHQARFEKYARDGDVLEDVPLAVLINAGSASGAEIVAGALKDHGRAELVGERTYGKGSVQSVVPLGGGSALKLTTARYMTPMGQSINASGIEPDLLVRNSNPEVQYRGRGSTISLSQDPQVAAALRLVGFDAIALSQAP